MKLLASQKMKTGALVLAGFILLVLAIFFIGNQKNMFDSTFKVQVKFSNVSGLQAGNFVRFTGINVGTVESIRILNDSTVNVTLALQKDVQKFIKNDAYATIGSDGLMGDKLVIIEHGSPASPMVKESEYLQGEDPVEMNDILARMGDVADNATILTGNLAEIVYKVNNGEGSLGRLLNSDQLAKKLEGTVSSTQQTVQSIQQGAEGFSDNMEAVKNSFLFRGYFRRKEKKRIADSIAAAKKASQGQPKKKNP